MPFRPTGRSLSLTVGTEEAGNLLFSDPAAWKRWRARRAAVTSLGRRGLFAPVEVATFGSFRPSDAAVVIAIDGVSPTITSSLLRPAALLRDRAIDVSILAPARFAGELSERGFDFHGPITERAAEALRPGVVLATQHSTQTGALAWRVAERASVPFVVVQHGVVTPYAPPLPERSRLFAWSDSDGVYWSRGVHGVEVAVFGSQLIYEAGLQRVPGGGRADATCFLGQLHGPELARRTTRRTVTALARQTSLAYRPHPDERDLRSTITHRLWKTRGVELLAGSQSLVDASRGRNVVGIFSTGILEAAAAGIPAFRFCVDPPRWLGELWDRYEMAPYEGEQGTVVSVPSVEPAHRIVDEVAALL